MLCAKVLDSDNMLLFRKQGIQVESQSQEQLLQTQYLNVEHDQKVKELQAELDRLHSELEVNAYIHFYSR